MANFATSVLVKAQAILIKKFQSPELRFRQPEVHKLFLRNRDIMTPDYKELKKSIDRVVETNYILRTSRALGSARSHNHTGAQGDSGILTPSWTTHTDKFASTIKEANNKVYDLATLHASKMENAVINFAEGLETVASTFAFANRSGVNVATAEGIFDATDDTFEITDSTNGERAIQITKMVMDINKYQQTEYEIICDSIAWNKFNFDSMQGTGNSTNTSFQFGGVTFLHDPKLTALAAGLVSSYAKGFWLAVPTGTIAGLDWIPKQNVMGSNFGNIATYGQIFNPVDGLTYAIHTYNVGSDGTSLGGQLQDVTIETEISIDMAYQNAPLSVATESTIMAFALV